MRQHNPDDMIDLAMVCLLVAIYLVWLLLISGGRAQLL
jgi:hypothetical protein